MDPMQLINKLSSPGDIAAVLLGFSFGFLLGLTTQYTLGVAPGSMGIVGMSTVLGLKKIFDSQQDKLRRTPEKMERPNPLDQQAEALSAILKGDIVKYEEQFAKGNVNVGSPNAYFLAPRFEREYNLWKVKLTNDDDFSKIIKNTIHDYAGESMSSHIITSDQK